MLQVRVRREHVRLEFAVRPRAPRGTRNARRTERGRPPPISIRRHRRVRHRRVRRRRVRRRRVRRRRVRRRVALDVAARTDVLETDDHASRELAVFFICASRLADDGAARGVVPRCRRESLHRPLVSRAAILGVACAARCDVRARHDVARALFDHRCVANRARCRRGVQRAPRPFPQSLGVGDNGVDEGVPVLANVVFGGPFAVFSRPPRRHPRAVLRLVALELLGGRLERVFCLLAFGRVVKRRAARLLCFRSARFPSFVNRLTNRPTRIGDVRVEELDSAESIFSLLLSRCPRRLFLGLPRGFGFFPPPPERLARFFFVRKVFFIARRRLPRFRIPRRVCRGSFLVAAIEPDRPRQRVVRVGRLLRLLLDARRLWQRCLGLVRRAVPPRELLLQRVGDLALGPPREVVRVQLVVIRRERRGRRDPVRLVVVIILSERR